MSTWQRISGLIDAPDSRVQRARGFLDGAQIIARLEFDPQEPSSGWISIAVEQDNHVAVLADDGQSVTSGPLLSELALALAQECQATVTFDRETVHAPPDDASSDQDPFDPRIGIVVVAERALVRITGDLESLEDLATRAQSTLLAAPTETGYLLLIEDGPAVAELPLAEAGSPAIVLQHAPDYPALSVVNGAEEYQHVWGLTAQVVPAGSPAAQEFADETLGLGLLLELVGAVVPDARGDQVREAVTEASGAPDAVAVLGLNAGLSVQARQFLLSELRGSQVDGAFEVEPLSVGEYVRRRAQQAADEARLAAGTAADDTRRRAQDAVGDARRLAEGAWRRTDDVWRRADEVWRWGEEGSGNPSGLAEEMLQQGVPYVAAGAEVLLGGLLWRGAGRGPRRGRPMGRGAKVLRGASVLLWAAAGANIAAATAYRIRRR